MKMKRKRKRLGHTQRDMYIHIYTPLFLHVQLLIWSSVFQNAILIMVYISFNTHTHLNARSKLCKYNKRKTYLKVCLYIYTIYFKS